MDAATFIASLRQAEPPALPAPLAALWHDAQGDWHRAHGIVQADASPQAARVHAYLHRKEGDLANAQYWYGRANVPLAECSLADEWRRLVDALVRPGGSAKAQDL